MDWLLPFLSTDFVKTSLGPQLVRYLVFGVVGWWVFSKAAVGFGKLVEIVANHFMEMVSEMKHLREEVHDFKDIFRGELRTADKRFKELEARSEQTDYRLGVLEIKIKQP